MEEEEEGGREKGKREKGIAHCCHFDGSAISA